MFAHTLITEMFHVKHFCDILSVALLA